MISALLKASNKHKQLTQGGKPFLRFWMTELLGWQNLSSGRLCGRFAFNGLTLSLSATSWDKMHNKVRLWHHIDLRCWEFKGSNSTLENIGSVDCRNRAFQVGQGSSHMTIMKPDRGSQREPESYSHWTKPGSCLDLALLKEHLCV